MSPAKHGTWAKARWQALHQQLQAADYRGYDPFDLLNAPLCRWFAKGHRLRFLVSRVGSRLTPIAVRRLLRVPPGEDPKIYACAFFGYLLSDEQDNRDHAKHMADRLAAMTAADKPTWGYPFDWPTRADGENPAGASTLVPTSFALLALITACVSGLGDYEAVIERALDYMATEHTNHNHNGAFLGYFTDSTVNTHNANLLGSLALTAGALLLQRNDLLPIARRATASSTAAVGEDGFLPYHDATAGAWTDCFHHIYATASLQAMQLLDDGAAVDNVTITRLQAYLDRTFPREDGTVDYYPGRRYPIDCHNGAATALYALTRPAQGPLGANAAEPLLKAFDQLTWMPRRQHYVHRIWRRWTDRRRFLRWNQAWMFWALAAVDQPQAWNALLAELGHHLRPERKTTQT